jgi:hypothetical protein
MPPQERIVPCSSTDKAADGVAQTFPLIASQVILGFVLTVCVFLIPRPEISNFRAVILQG